MKRLFLLMALVAGAAHAQTVYRCGDGKQYSQTPCPGGKAVVADDARSPEQQRQAAAAARADAARATALATERREREAAAAAAAKGQLAAGIKPPAPAASAPKPPTKPKKKPRQRAAEPADDKLSAPVKAPAIPKKGKVAQAA